MKPMKVETCPTCRWKTIRRATCADCQMLGWDHRNGDLCYRGRTAKRLCKEFIPRPGVEILKERKEGAE